MAKIEFVEYTGKYPNLCRGDFLVKIDGVLTLFGDYLDEESNPKRYPPFWESGGCVGFSIDWDEEVQEGPWHLATYDPFPEEIERLFPELIRIFNEHVPWGCCGGCV